MSTKFATKLVRGAAVAVLLVFAAVRVHGQCPQIAPTVISPSNVWVDPTQAVTFSWTGVTGATGYDVLLSSDNGSTFSTAASTSATATTASVKQLGPGTYIWAVRANFSASCAPLVSRAAGFAVPATNCPTTGVTLQLPPDNASVSVPVTFNWSTALKAIGYSVFIQPSGTTTPVLLGSTTIASKLITDAVPQGTMQWWVRTFYDACPPVDSQHFTLTIVSASGCPTTAATLVSPADGASNVKNPVAFDWNDVAGASGYRLYAAVNGGSPSPIAVTKDSQFAGAVPNGSVEWYVETTFDNCPSTFSPHFHLTTAANTGCPVNPDVPQTVAPADGATNLASPVTFQWTPAQFAVNYSVVATATNGSPFVVGNTTATQLSAPLPQGSFTWVVVASFGDDCAPTVSKRATFTVTTGTACNNTPATLTFPANGATNIKSPVDFQWNAAQGATGYKLFVAVGGAPFELLGTTTSTDLQKIVPSGAIAWYVEAQFQGCADQNSTTFNFAVAQPPSCANGPITLIAPAIGATMNSPVSFAWTPITGATSYRLWVSIDGSAPITVTRPTVPAATVRLSSGSVDWYVEALLNGCPSLLSAHGSFTVTKKPNCGSNQAPTLVSPVASGTQPASTGTDVTFKWTAVTGAIAYRVWLAAAGQPFGDVGVTQDTQLTHTLPARTFSWYVEAQFDGCPPVASAKSTFTVDVARCTNDAPTLLWPLQGSATSSSPTLLWSVVDGVDQYRVWASVDGSQPILIGVSDDSSMTRPLPPGNIRWRVEATFKGCSSTRSAWSKFNVVRAASCPTESAQLVTPANGSVDPNQPVNFSWTDVNGAAGYVLFVKANDGAATPVVQTRDTQYSKRTPEGTIEWWVVTFVSGCPPMESKHAKFTVAATDCVKIRPLALAPVDGSQLISPVTFAWTPVPKASGYKVWAIDSSGMSLLASTTITQATASVPSGSITWQVEATFAGCPSTRSPQASFKVLKAAPACTAPDQPLGSVAGQVVSGSAYKVRWTPVANADHYELQESTATDFSGATTRVVDGISAAFSHTATAPTQYLYRVRAISSCSDDVGAYSDVVSVFVMPPGTAGQKHATAEIGSQGTVVQTLTLPGSPTPVTFNAKADKPWLKVTPSSGTITPQGVPLTVTADPSSLVLGTSTGTVQVTYGAGAGAKSLATTATNIPISISLVTPVAPAGKNTPPPDSLVIPVVSHAPGANNSMFESDVRVANTSAQTMKYQVDFTPSNTDGTQSSNTTTIQVDPGATMALDDILASFFGAAAANANAAGVLEVRPLTSTTSTAAFAPVSTANLGVQLTTIASSRTFNVTPNGTFGQFIPAIPFSQFIGAATSDASAGVLSFQQVAQSAAYRTNFGLVEGAGEPANVMLTVFNNAGDQVGQIPQALLPSEHLQLNQVLAANNISLTDGRIEVTVTSPTGKVTAYASTIDNITNDPLLVPPVLKGAVSASHYTLPGISDFDTGGTHWKSDVRIFNSGTTRVDVTMAYSPQGAPGQPLTTTSSINPGQVLAIDDFIQSAFPSLAGTNTAGAVIVTTDTPSSLVTTARTYTDTGNGTYGQFIPGVTAADGVGSGDRALQLLQLEQSTQLYTNIGVAETTGNPATAEISLILPDSAVSPTIDIPLAANEFRQIPLAAFALSNEYNVRATVKVVPGTGTGKITAYGSVIDQVTHDPTYVPAQ